MMIVDYMIYAEGKSMDNKKNKLISEDKLEKVNGGAGETFPSSVLETQEGGDTWMHTPPHRDNIINDETGPANK